jgi:sigma-B regulation protein RsbU (phosphoserine phosphatase)
MFQNTHYHQHFIRLEIGQILVLYTDGITEASREDGEEYGQDRFARRIMEGFDLPAKDIIQFVRQGITEFTEQESLKDDATLFIIKAL